MEDNEITYAEGTEDMEEKRGDGKRETNHGVALGKADCLFVRSALSCAQTSGDK